MQGSVKWLTIPVKPKGRFWGPIEEIETDGQNWAEQHWKTITHAYGRAAYFAQYQAILEAAYQRAAALGPPDRAQRALPADDHRPSRHRDADSRLGVTLESGHRQRHLLHRRKP